MSVIESSAGDERLSRRGPVQSLLVRPEVGALLGALGVWAAFWSVSARDVFGTAAGTATYLDVAAPTGIMAVAVALLMIGGEFDLSSGAMTGATGMLVILLAKEAGEFGGAGLPLLVAMPLSLAFALAVGWFNGTMVERTSLPSFIVTLGAFFMLRGGKLGFAKLFTDKVIVEGLDTSSGYGLVRPFFASLWTRNEHPLESRDAIFLALALLAGALLTIGLMELSFVRREKTNPAGLPLLAVGLAAIGAGIIGLHVTGGEDAFMSNLLSGVVIAAGYLLAVFGLATTRYEPGIDGTTDTDGRLPMLVGGGLVSVALAMVSAALLDSDSQSIMGFLLTEQGLRGVLFVLLSAIGVGMILLGARGGTPTQRLALKFVAAAAIVALAFFIQSQSTSVKFRTEFFTTLLMAATALAASALIESRFAGRKHIDAAADVLGRRLALGAVAAAVGGVVVKLLFMTQAEIDATQAQIVFRVSVLWFIIVTAFGAWLLARTKFGSWIFAVGGNKLAARSVGVPAARTKTTLFLMVSGAAWLVGMLRAFRFNSVQADVGDGEEFFYIIAAVVGGNLLTGGYGSAVGGAIGALIIAMSGQGIANAGWNSNWRFLFLGGILLVAVIVNNYVREKAEAAR